MQAPTQKRTYGGTRRAIDNMDVDGMIKILEKEDFGEFSKTAYASKEGYAIRMNPYTGEKEMFVAGTRDVGQWALNVQEGASMKLDAHRKKVMTQLGVPPELQDHVWFETDQSWLYKKTRGKTEKELADIAKREGVDVVYGHSRGAALIADSKWDPDTRVVALDGAMMLAKNKDVWNLNEGGTGFTGEFDAFIGQGGMKNQSLDLGPNIHHVWD